MDRMITTVSVMVDVLVGMTDQTAMQEMRIRIDRISGMTPDGCTKDDAGNLILDGINVSVRKGFNKTYRAFRSYNDVRSIAPFN